MSQPNKVTWSVGARWRRIAQQVDDTLDNNTLLGRPLRWYVSGWRLGLIAIIIAVIYPFFFEVLSPDSSQNLISTAIQVGIYVLLALGLNIVVGYAGLLDLGYVAFFVIGSYTVAVGTGGIIKDFSGKVQTIPSFSLWLLLGVGALLAGIFGVLLGAPTLRLRGDYLAIVTLGFGEIVPVIFLNTPNFFGSFGITAVPPEPLQTPFGVVDFGSFTDHTAFYFLTLACIVLIVFFVVALRDSSLGRAWIAIREDETAASASGVNLVRTKLLAFGLGAAIGGLGGVLNGAFLTHVDPDSFTFGISITVLVMIVLGGIGSLPGVIVGAILLQFFNVYVLNQVNNIVHGNFLVASSTAPLHFLYGFDFNTAKFLIIGIVLLLIIILRPQGLIPNVRRQRELKGEGVAGDALSVVGVMQASEAAHGVSGIGIEGTSEFTGPGADAQGRDD